MKNYTNLSLNINKQLKDDFKEKVKIENRLMKSVLRDEIKKFIFEYEVNKNENSKYIKDENTLLNIELPTRYKEKLFEIIKEDNHFFKIKEIITYIIKRYVIKH